MAKQDVLTIEFDSNDEEFEAYRDEIETLRAKLLACTAVAAPVPLVPVMGRFEISVSEKRYAYYQPIVVEAANIADARNIGERWYAEGWLGSMELTYADTDDIEIEINVAAVDAPLSEAR